MPTRIRSFLLCFYALSALFVFKSQASSSIFENFIKSPDFRAYAESLEHFQRLNPGVFVPLELIRIDRLPEEEFLEQGKRYSSAWRAIGAKNFGKNLRDERIRISREANAQLDALVKKSRSQVKASLRGSRSDFLNAIPSESRLALTPLDPIFQSSEIGKKIAKDLEKKDQSAPYSFSLIETEGKKQIRLEDKNGAIFYSLDLSRPSNEALKFRGKYTGSIEPAGSDLMIPSSLLRGSFFNETDSSLLPFGRMPKGKDIWLEEGGQSHFGGDGHNH